MNTIDQVKTPTKYGFHKIPLYGTDYLNLLQKRTKNPFWISVAKAIKSFHAAHSKAQIEIPFLDQPIWFNPHININFIKKWDRSGLRVVRDVILKNGHFKSINDIENDYGIKMKFMDHALLTRSIPKSRLLTVSPNDHPASPWVQSYIVDLLANNKSNELKKNIFKRKTLLFQLHKTVGQGMSP